MGNLTKQLRVGYVCITNFGSEFTERKKKPTKILYMGFKMYKIYKMLMKQLQLDKIRKIINKRNSWLSNMKCPMGIPGSV